MSLTGWIFIGMVAGIALGVGAPGVAVHLGIVSDIFLRLIKSIIAPLLFGTLVYGIAGSGSIKQMGRIGLKAIVYFELVTTVALFLGLGAVNLVRPGDDVIAGDNQPVGPQDDAGAERILKPLARKAGRQGVTEELSEKWIVE